MIKAVIADDIQILRQGLRAILEQDKDIRVVGLAADGREAWQLCRKLKPDVVLMDMRMPQYDGSYGITRIKADFPDIRVLVLTTFDDSDYILSALNNGACGYLLKDIGASALIEAIKNAYAGDTILPAKIARRIADAAKNVSSDREIKLKRAFSLSDREVEIALMLYEGFTNRQISSALKISEGTTRNYISAIYVKTGSENRSGAVEAIKSVL